MIRFEQVTKRFGDSTVLDEVSFAVEPGEVFVIVGRSGTGKSVSLKHMVRLLTPDAGQVWVGDEIISNARGRRLERLRAKFGFLFQGGALLQWMNVADNVALPLRQNTRMDEEEIGRRVRSRLAVVGLESALAKMPSDISGGMRKRVGLARAIVSEPDIVLYDEPTSGLDPVTSRTIDELIRDMQRQFGMTSIVVTHDLHSALRIADHIGMLHDGAMLPPLTPSEFIRSTQPVIREFLEAQYITRRGDWETEETVP